MKATIEHVALWTTDLERRKHFYAKYFGARSVGSVEQVDALTRRLKDDGFAILDGPRRTGDGYYESVALDPDGNRVEITA